MFEEMLASKAIINQPDNDGNTLLHFAAMYQKYDTMLYLLDMKNSPVNCNAVNKEQLTVLDIIDKIKFDYDKDIPENYLEVQSRLSSSTRLCRKDVFSENRSTWSLQLVEDKRKRRESQKEKIAQQIQNVSDSHLVVATLIATMAFTAGFTIPGGYKSDGPNEGTATLVRRACFEVFAVSNTVAMLFSSFAVVVHFLMKLVNDKKKSSRLLIMAFLCTFASIMAMMLAFVAGTYTVLAHSPGLAISTCIIGCSFYLFCSLLLCKYYRAIELPVYFKSLYP